ncbi:hypothetical protein GCM10029978_055710 [Actinoallomurus acanthiterrae]
MAAAGHSLGEITALHWAGALTEPDTVALVTARGRIMADAGAHGTGMLSVAAPRDVVASLIVGTDLVTAADNGAAQVVAGTITDIDLVADRAQAAGVVAQRLNVSHAFHSPAVAPAEPALAHYLADVPVAAVRRRVYSTVSGRELNSADDLRRMLAAQVTGPVRFREALQLLAADCDVLVETGPGHSLTMMARSITDVPAVALDVGAESALPLCDATGALFAAGACDDLTVLFAGRFHRPFDLWRDPQFLANPCESAPGADLVLQDAYTPARVAARAHPHTSSARSGSEGDVGDTYAAMHGDNPLPPAANRAAAERDGATAMDSCDLPSLVRQLIAEAVELPLDAIDDSEFLLGDLHLSSLRVVQLTVQAAKAAGRAAPAGQQLMTETTVGTLIETIEQLPSAAEDSERLERRTGGVAEWHRVLIPETRPADPPGAPQRLDWRILGTGSLRASIEPRLQIAPHTQPAYLVFLPEDPDDDAIGALLDGTRRALAEDAPLTVVDQGDTASGFLGTIAQEHPGRPVRWVRATTDDRADVLADVLVTSWNGHAEVVVDEAGHVRTTAYRPAVTRGTGAPLSPGQVLLVTGGGKGIGFHSALFLARRWGVRLGLIGRSRPENDKELHAGLARLREAGVNVHYEAADVTDAATLRRSVHRITAALGPIAGILHASGLNRPARFADLTPDDFAGHAAPKHHALRALLDAVDRPKLRLLITYGSVIGRFGLPGEAHYALANGRMRELSRVLSRELPDCRVCDVDWTVWSGAGMAERLDVLDTLDAEGVVPLPAERGVELLAQVAEAPPEAHAVIVSGRLPQLDLADGAPIGEHRFLRRTRSWTPGVELVAETEISVADDPYLLDHRIDGVLVLPAVCLLEAMAQAAAVITGGPVRGVVNTRFDRPVVIPDNGHRTIQVSALTREDGDVDIVVRSDETGLAVSHAAGTVTCTEAAPPDVPGGGQRPPAHDGGALYGPLFFHGPRFHRLGAYTHLEATACTAVLRGDRPWQFGPGLPSALRFGDPARNDASIHIMQGCVPHRRLLPTGCARFTVHQRQTDGGDLTLRAIERGHSGADHTYDVLLQDAAGRPVVSWSGLRLRDVGPLPASGGRPAAIVGPYVNRHLAELSAGRDVRLDLTVAGEPVMTAAGGDPAACAWVPDVAGPPDPRWASSIAELTHLCGESEPQIHARLHTIYACLGTSVPLRGHRVHEDGWIVLRADGDDVISAMFAIDGHPRQLALAVLIKGGS